MTYADPAETKNGKELKGWHVLVWMLGFFGVVFAVNGVFLYHAITSHPGEDHERSYLRGLNFNAEIEARRAQEALGWQAEIGFIDGELAVRIMDASGDPMTGLDVTGVVRRKATTSEDRLVMFASLADGYYHADEADLAGGAWQVDVAARRSGETETVFRATRTLTAP